jgi:hypothetical protein
LSRAFPTADQQEVRSLTLDLARKLLQVKGIRACQYNEQRGFEYWDMNIDEIIARIAREWDDLNWVPTLGDIVWFVAE